MKNIDLKNTEKYTGNKIYLLRRKKGWDKARLAKEAGTTEAAVRAWESGQTKFKTVKTLYKIAKAFDVDIDILLNDNITPFEVAEAEPKYLTQSEPETTTIPLYAVNPSAGNALIKLPEKIESHYRFRTDWLKKIGPIEALKLFKVEGNSMEPTISNGDLVLVDSSESAKKIIDGKIYLFSDAAGFRVKRLQRVGRLIRVISDNKIEYEPYEIDLNHDYFKIFGRVRWVGHELK